MNIKKIAYRWASSVYYAAAFLIVLPATSTLAIEPAPIKVGNLDFIPTLNVRYGYDDNVLLDEDIALGSSVLMVRPSIQTFVEGQNGSFSFEFDVTDVDYANSPKDSYTDWEVRTSGARRVATRHAFDFTASFQDTHEFRGTEFSDDLIVQLPIPSDYDNIDFQFGYTFGAQSAKGSITMNAGATDRNYTNNRTITLLQDFESELYGVTFLYKAQDISDFSIRYTHNNIDYDVDAISSPLTLLGSRDSSEEYIFLGWDWRPRTTFTANLLVGYGEKTFSSPLREGGSLPSWDVSLSWSPLTYSTFSFSASNRFTESFGLGDGVESNSISLGWSHDWAERFSSHVDVSYQDNEFGGLGRNDTREDIAVGFSYSAKRWLDVTFDWSLRDTDSNFDTVVFEQNIFTLGFLASL